MEFTLLCSKNIALRKGLEAAIDVVRICRAVQCEHREYDITRQLIRSATSVGANIAEGIGAQTTDEFAHKLTIAYRECMETRFHVHLLKSCGLMPAQDAQRLDEAYDAIGAILFASIRTSVRSKRDTAAGTPRRAFYQDKPPA
jgi:four helix bundle protein